MSKKPVAVRIAGHDYKLRSDGDDGSLQKLAGYVDRAMNRVRERTGTVDSLDVAVLTCLNLAREILTLRDQKSDGADAGKLQSLIERVEAALGAEAPTALIAPANPSGKRDSESSASHAPRTLELPSVEALRERTTASTGERVAGSEEASMPEARVASGGRDRAS